MRRGTILNFFTYYKLSVISDNKITQNLYIEWFRYFFREERMKDLLKSAFLWDIVVYIGQEGECCVCTG